MQKDRGKLTEKGCYTLTPEIDQKLRQLSFETGKSRSLIFRTALEMYFDLLDMEKELDMATEWLGDFDETV